MVFFSLHVSLQFIQSWFMKIASFICLQQRIISSLYCFTYTGFQKQKQTGVSLNKLILYWGGGIYARTKIKPSIIKAATTQIKKSRNIFLSVLVDICPSHQSSCFPSSYPCSFSFLHVSCHFLSVKGCLAFKIFFNFCFCCSLYKK